MSDLLELDRIFHPRSAWMALLPALILVSYLLIGLTIYLLRARRGTWQDPELQVRGSSVVLGMPVRLFFSWLVRPWWMVLQRYAVPPHAVTTLSVLLAAGAGVAVAAGYFGPGGWLYLLAGLCDFLDGKLARATGQASRQGAALDSVLDRYCELAFASGLAWFYRDSWGLAVMLAVLTGSMLVPYVRARGEGLGASFPNVGLMQRPERIVLLGGAVAFSPIFELLVGPIAGWPAFPVAVAVAMGVGAATHITAIHRLLYLFRFLAPRKAGPGFFGQGSMFRNLVAAGLATGIDFSVVAALMVATWTPAPIATLVGCLVGGVVNFTVNRVWAFGADGSYVRQGARYAFVSATSALLNAGGVAVLLLLPSIHYALAWVIVRVSVSLAWNYPLHRNYVFSGEVEDEDAVETRREVAR